jgi:hypothetical protein
MSVVFRTQRNNQNEDRLRLRLAKKKFDFGCQTQGLLERETDDFQLGNHGSPLLLTT